MKKRMVWRYTCEFCKKSNCSSYHMRRHEESCTLNPDRKCKMCHMTPDVADLIAAANQCTEEDLRPLREAAEHCPACMLAGIRQSKRQEPPTSFDDPGFWFSFDFKKEKESWWSDRNSEEACYY